MSGKLLAGISLSASLLLAACGGGDPAVEVARGGTVEAQVAVASAAGFPLYLETSGNVESFERARIGTRVMGYVRQVLVEEGDRVRAGQLLLRLDSRDAVSRIEQAEAGLAAAESSLRNTEAYFNRIKNLHEQQSATRQNLDTAQSQYETAKAGADAARNRISEARSQLDYFNIRAPFSGFVTGRSVDPGDMASPGAPLLTVETQDSVKIVTTLSEQHVGKVSAGQTALVRTDVPGQSMLEARVESVVPANDPATRRFSVQLVAPNSAGALVSGMFARVMFQIGTDRTVSVPESAIVRRGQLTGLYVLDGENFTRLRWVRLGRVSGQQVEVLSGLEAGERVVAGGLRLMREGVSVREVNS